MKKKHTKLKTPRPPRKDFAEKLADKLRLLGIGEVEEGSFSDDSGRWVEFKIKDKSLSFSFDMKGEKMDGLNFYVDKVEIVDQVLVWGNRKP